MLTQISNPKSTVDIERTVKLSSWFSEEGRFELLHELARGQGQVNLHVPTIKTRVPAKERFSL